MPIYGNKLGRGAWSGRRRHFGGSGACKGWPAGKKSTTSLSLFMEACGLEIEEELSTLATQYWEEGAWMGTWYQEQREAWMKQDREVQTWREVRGPAGAVMCETRDLGIKWPHWHTTRDMFAQKM